VDVFKSVRTVELRICRVANGTFSSIQAAWMVACF